MASTTFLNKAYLAYFGRPMDITGSRDFASASETDVETAFAASPESIALYGTEIQADFVNAVYNHLFGRDAEPAGAAYWLNEYARGAISAAGMALSILEGARGQDADIITNKLAAAWQFYSGLDEPDEIYGYTTMTAAALARDFLSTVEDPPATAGQVDGAIALATRLEANTGDAIHTSGKADETFTLGTAGDNVGNGQYSNDLTRADAYANDRIIFYGAFGDDVIDNFTLDTDTGAGEATAGFDILDFSALVNGGTLTLSALISGTNTTAREVATRFTDDTTREESVYIAYGLDNIADIYRVVDGTQAGDLDVTLLGTLDLGDDLYWYQIAIALNGRGTDSIVY